MNCHKKKKVNGVNDSSGVLARRVVLGSGGRSPPRPPEPSSSKSYSGQKEKVRVATLNIGSLSGKSREVAELLRKRNVKIGCLQETRWRGNSAREIGEGYKLFYAGESSGRNGVGVVVDSDLRDSVVDVRRSSSRLMMLKIVWKGVKVNVISAYAPQVGLGKDEKEKFWEEFDELIGSVSGSERLWLGVT